MNSGRDDRRLSRWMDGELGPKQAAAVEARLERSAEARRTQASFAEAGERLRGLDAPAGPTPEAAWAGVQRALRLDEGETGRRPRRVPGFLVSRPIWAGVMLAVLVGGAAWLAVLRPDPAGRMAAVPVPAVVESVETDLPGAMTMVYQDEETGLTLIWVQEAKDREPAHVDS